MKNKYIIAPGIAVMCSAVISSGYASSDKKKIRLLLLPPGSLSSSEMPRPVSQSLLQNNCKKPVSDLVDAVKDVEGISITGGNEKPDISIRGLSGDYTLILVDGRRQSGRESRPNGSGGFEAGFIPPCGSN